MTLLTLGHGTASEEEFGALVRAARLDAIVDVRTVPKSRRHPQYCREAMERWVPERTGAAYRWEPALGGFRRATPCSGNVALRHPSFRGYADYMETRAFAAALTALLVEAARGRTAALCAETVWWRCHRRLIADAACLLHGADVRHVMHDATLRPHVLTAGVRIADDGTLRYDVLFAATYPDVPA